MPEDLIETVKFTWTRSPHYRTTHVGGAWATVTPATEVQIAFFNDLNELPDTESHRLKPDGTLAERLDPDVKHVVREAETTVVMHVETAKRVVQVLNMMIESAENRFGQSTTRTSSDSV